MRSFDSTTGQETWITPPQLQQSLGHFDLDPCAADVMPYKTADVMITKEQDGLKQDWTGKRVWLNPPYGRAIVPFLEKMRLGVALLPARTDNRWFHDLVCPRACGILFVRGRIRFLGLDGSVSGTPAFASMLVGYSKEDVISIVQAIPGTLMEITK